MTVFGKWNNIYKNCKINEKYFGRNDKLVLYKAITA